MGRARKRTSSPGTPKALTVGGPKRKWTASQLSRMADQILNAAKARERHRYPSEDRLDSAMHGNPLPGSLCHCQRCEETRHAVWPSIYMVPAREQHTGRRVEVSFECYLHSQSEFFLENLPSSSSIVRFG